MAKERSADTFQRRETRKTATTIFSVLNVKLLKKKPLRP